MYTAHIVAGRSYTAYDNGKVVFTTTDPAEWDRWYAENEAHFAPETNPKAELLAELETWYLRLKTTLLNS